VSASFDFDEVDQFLCGTIGEPGARVFFLQVVRGTSIVSVKLEKQQVALLADYLDRLLSTQELPDGPPASSGDLVLPVIAEWVVGSMMVAINEATGRVVVIAQEIGDEADDEELETLDEDDDEDLSELRIALTRNQVVEFIAAARDLVAGGRPSCRLCGRPMDPDGHVCPRWN
jgi:uncharacterized repeat protein (TIGR03847 family)